MTETNKITEVDQSSNSQSNSVGHMGHAICLAEIGNTETATLDPVGTLSFGMGARYYDELNVTSPYTFWNGA